MRSTGEQSKAVHGGDERVTYKSRETASKTTAAWSAGPRRYKS
jgi:hypothetical protein